MSEVKSEIQSILNSRGFRQSRGLAKLLRYLCSNALVDEPDQVTEYSIAVDILGKAPDFKDAKDASVRVEVHRLRKRLIQFYEEEGASHRIRIVIPTGNYAPRFVVQAEAASSENGCGPLPVPVSGAGCLEERWSGPSLPDPLGAPDPGKGTTAVSTAPGCEGPVAMPGDERRQALVRAQLERVLDSAAFRNSRRYAAVLRYIVNRTLEGAGDQLKERTIGAAVFGYPPGYDTTNNHVVRSAVAEVRKRIAQYYQEGGDGSELRIELQPGSYTPQFRFPIDRSTPLPADATAAVPDRGRAPETRLPEGPRRSWLRRGIGAALGLAVLTLAVVFQVFGSFEDPLEAFWRPVLSGSGEALLCVGNVEGGQRPPPGSRRPVDDRALSMVEFHNLASQSVLLGDATTLSRLAGLLTARGKSYKILSQSEATFTDLQNSDVVLVGLRNNDWTERLVGRLRFTVEKAGPGKLYIRDRDNPSRTDWALDYSTPYLEVTRDYALVLRVLDPKTERMVVAAAGISVFGTQAAGELLTKPNEIRKLEALAPGGWKGKNLEIVLSTDVIRGRSGHPTVVATHFW